MAQTPVTSYKKPGQGTPNSANNNAQGNAAPHPQVADHPPTTLSSLLFTEETDERVLAMLFNQLPQFRGGPCGTGTRRDDSALAECGNGRHTGTARMPCKDLR